MRELSTAPPTLRWLLLVAFCLRLGWGLSRASDAASIASLPDQREYFELADNLLHGRGLHFVDPRFGEEVYAYRTPGYPFFLAACGASPVAARMVQASLDTSTVLAVYLLARRWLSHAQSLFAASVAAFNPFLIYFSGLLLSETLYTCLLVWGMLLLWPRGTSDGTPHLRGYLPLAGGLLIAAGVLVRPSGVGLPVLLGVGAAVMNRGRAPAYPRGWPLPPATTMLLFTLACLAPWAYRNEQVLHRWVWTTTNAGITAYDGFNDDATGASDQQFTTHTPGLAQASEIERDEFFAEEATQWVRKHQARAAQLAALKVLRTWTPVPLSAEFGRPLYRWVAGLYAVPLYGFVIVAVLGRGLPRGAKVFLLIPAIYITTVHAISVGSLRYRIPAEPLLAVLAGSAFVRHKGTDRSPVSPGIP